MPTYERDEKKATDSGALRGREGSGDEQINRLRTQTSSHISVRSTRYGVSKRISRGMPAVDAQAKLRVRGFGRNTEQGTLILIALAEWPWRQAYAL